MWRFFQDFLAAPPIKPFRALVPISDFVVQGAYEDGIVGPVQKFRLCRYFLSSALQLSCALLNARLQLVVGIPQCFRYLFALGDVQHDTEQAAFILGKLATLAVKPAKPTLWM